MNLKMLYVHVLPIDLPCANVIQVLQMCQAFSDCGIDLTLAVPTSKNMRSDLEYRRTIKRIIGINRKSCQKQRFGLPMTHLKTLAAQQHQDANQNRKAQKTLPKKEVIIKRGIQIRPLIFT